MMTSLPAIPVRSDGSRRPARSESAAIPAPPVKTGPAIPEGWTSGACPPPFDDFGRLIARQETVVVRRTAQRPLSLRAARRRDRRRQNERRNRDDNGSEVPCPGRDRIIVVVVAHCAFLSRRHPYVPRFATLQR